jgi:hypothetical protein
MAEIGKTAAAAISALSDWLCSSPKHTRFNLLNGVSKEIASLLSVVPLAISAARI